MYSWAQNKNIGLKLALGENFVQGWLANSHPTSCMQPKKKFLWSKLESRISDFSTFFGVFFQVFVLSCGPKSQYFWQNFQVAAHSTIWVGHPWISIYIWWVFSIISSALRTFGSNKKEGFFKRAEFYKGYKRYKGWVADESYECFCGILPP